MSYKSGFFNSINHDRLYNAEDMSNYFEGLVTDGVYESVGNALCVKAGSGMDVTVGTGRALIDCHWLKNSSTLSLTLPPADILNDRTDLVVVKLDKNISAREMTIELLTGASGTLQNTDNIKYLTLAKIKVKAGTSGIKQADIEDMRGTNSCRYVCGLIEQISTETLFLQYKAAFEDWFATLSEELKIDTYIGSYRKKITTTSSRTYAMSGRDFDHTKDLLYIYLNGFLVPPEKYSLLDGTVSGGGGTVTFNFAMEAGNEVEFIILDSKVGSSSVGIN